MLLTGHNLRDTRVDMVSYSENQEAKHATNALLANRAALTQNMEFVQNQGIGKHMAQSRTN